MKPIVITDRSDLSGWHAYQRPLGRYVFWDGGLNPSEKCLYDVETLESVPCRWVNELPLIPLVGYKQREAFVAVDSIHPILIKELVGVEQVPDGSTYFQARDEPTLPAPFFYVFNKLTLLGGRVETPKVVILPEDSVLAFNTVKEMASDGSAIDVRHPHSPWQYNRSSAYATTQTNCYKVKGHLRDFSFDEEFGVEELEFWKGPSRTIKTPPLYDQDLDPLNLTRKEPFTIYLSFQGNIIGYEST